MYKEQGPSEGSTRRSFLKKFSLGLATLAGAGFLFRDFLFADDYKELTSGDEFPGEDSIFHPRRDPRLEARERRKET